MVLPAWPANSVERWAIARLKPFARNARKHPPKQIEQIRGAMRAFGWTVPILVREDGTIIAGHARLDAGLAEGFAEVPVIVARGWTEQQCRSYTLADNRIALNGTWDEDILKLELAELSALGIDLNGLGFELPELGRLIGPAEGLTDPDDVPEPTPEPVSALGDVWLLGRHRLVCGDSTVAGAVAAAFNGVTPQLMITDPPYGVEYDPGWRKHAGLKQDNKRLGKVANDDRADWREAWALFPGSVAYVWHAGLFASTVQDSLTATGFDVRAQIIWAKDRFALSRGHYHWGHEPCWYAVRQGSANANWTGDRRQTTLWQIPTREGASFEHGTQKPVECMKRPIDNNSSPGQAVYEPFSGSGTTIIAAEMTGRCCHAIELMPAYVDVAVRRWQDFTGRKATREADGVAFDDLIVAAESRGAG